MCFCGLAKNLKGLCTEQEAWCWKKWRKRTFLSRCWRRKLLRQTLRGLFFGLGLWRTMESYDSIPVEPDSGVSECEHGAGGVFQRSSRKGKDERMVFTSTCAERQSEVCFAAHRKQRNPSPKSMVECTGICSRRTADGLGTLGRDRRLLDGWPPPRSHRFLPRA